MACARDLPFQLTSVRIYSVWCQIHRAYMYVYEQLAQDCTKMRSGRELNPQPAERKSSALRHRATQ